MKTFFETLHMYSTIQHIWNYIIQSTAIFFSMQGSPKNGAFKFWNILIFKKKNFMALFYGWGSTASRLEPLRGGRLLFTTKFREIPGTHFIGLWRMRGWANHGATQWIWMQYPWVGNQLYIFWNPMSCKNGKITQFFQILYRHG